MVCVAEDLLGNFPSFVPRYVLFVDKDPHELRNGYGRVRLNDKRVSVN